MANDHRHMDLLFVHRGTFTMHLVGATELPMVGGKDDNRILRQLQVIQLIENRLKMLVIIANTVEIIIQ